MNEIKAVQIKFFDNDFCSAALGAAKALVMVVDITDEPEEVVLEEFKFLIHRLANAGHRVGESGCSEVSAEYFDKCTVEKLTYVPREWSNSESVVYDVEEGKITLL
jgi:hypothetical protein